MIESFNPLNKELEDLSGKVSSHGTTMRGVLAGPTEDGYPAVMDRFPAIKQEEIEESYRFSFAGTGNWGRIESINGVNLSKATSLFLHRDGDLIRFDYGAPHDDGHGGATYPVKDPEALLSVLSNLNIEDEDPVEVIEKEDQSSKRRLLNKARDHIENRTGGYLKGDARKKAMQEGLDAYNELKEKYSDEEIKRMSFAEEKRFFDETLPLATKKSVEGNHILTIDKALELGLVYKP